MKHINLILSVLFWAIASICMAVKLPSSSFSGSFFLGADSYEAELGTGARMVGADMLTASASGVDFSHCVKEGVPQDVPECETCCAFILPMGPSYAPLYTTCLNSCGQGKALGEITPIGNVLFLLPFIAIYAVIRKRKEETL